jgi:glycosyltransferase involved in cell wall biosynthesis
VKVVHLLSGDLWAGTEAATYELLRALAVQPGVHARAVLLNRGVLADRLAAAGLLQAVEPESGRGFAALARAVRGQLAAADLVHTHGYKPDVIGALSGRPWLSTQHGRPEPARGLARLRIATYHRLALAAQRFGARRVIAVSSEVDEWLRPRVGAAKVVRLWNGIDDPCPEGGSVPWGERPLRVGALCRLFPVKNLALAIEAVARSPGLELEIVGDGPEAPRLRALAATLGVSDRVLFAGFDPEPAARLARWRALLVPSFHEGNPLAVIEALAWGTPVVAGPLRGIAEMLAGRGGWCLPALTVEAWVAGIARALGADEGAAASVAGRARFLEAFTSAGAAARVRALYAEVLGSA